MKKIKENAWMFRFNEFCVFHALELKIRFRYSKLKRNKGFMKIIIWIFCFEVMPMLYLET